MKDQTQIEERLRRLVQEALDARMADVGVKLPHKCQFNHRQPLDARKAIYDEGNPQYNRISSGTKSPEGRSEAVEQTLGLCMYNHEDPAEWAGRICEDPVDAHTCPYKYTPMVTITEIYEEFCLGIVRSEWRRENVPEVESLLWVLGAGLETGVLSEPVKPSFWAVLKTYFLKSDSSPQLPPPEGEPADITIYLPSLDDYADNGTRKTVDS